MGRAVRGPGRIGCVAPHATAHETRNPRFGTGDIGVCNWNTYQPGIRCSWFRYSWMGATALFSYSSWRHVGVWDTCRGGSLLSSQARHTQTIDVVVGDEYVAGSGGSYSDWLHSEQRSAGVLRPTGF